MSTDAEVWLKGAAVVAIIGLAIWFLCMVAKSIAENRDNTWWDE